MTFINPSSPIPITSPAFQKIITFYLFECPARTITTPKKWKDLPNSEKYKDENYHFHRVSMRGMSFEDRGLTGAKLNSLRAAMLRVADSKNFYHKYVEDKEITPDLIPSDCDEFIIRKGRNISQTEGIFYSIRNSFAHGGFEVIGDTYKFENINKGKTKALMQLRDRTLLNWIDLVNMPIEEIKRAGK